MNGHGWHGEACYRKFFSSKKKKLTKKIAKELLDKGWCRVTGLYTPKKPQLYDAAVSYTHLACTAG